MHATWLRIATRNLWRNRSRTLLATGAVAVSLWVMVSLRAYMDSVHVAVLKNVTQGEIGYLQIHKKGYHRNADAKGLRYTFADTPALRARVAAVAGVKALTPRLMFGGALALPDDPTTGAIGVQTFLVIVGLEPETGRSVLPLPYERIQAGRMFTHSDADEIVVHKTVANNLKLTFPAPAGLPPEARPALLSYDADGALHGRLLEPVGDYLDGFGGDRAAAMMPLAAAQRVLGLEGKVTEYVIDLVPGATEEATQTAILAALGPDFEVFRWDEKIPIIKQNFLIEETGFNIGILIFFVVAALGSVNTMMMTVMERTREVGTMMAIGTNGRQVIGLFVLEGAIIGALGGLLGVLLGAVTITYLNVHGLQIPPAGIGIPLDLWPEISMPYMVRAFAFGFLGLAGASLWPAWRAARLSPVEALHCP